jgi:xylan 1,4-beta-xylosidase
MPVPLASGTKTIFYWKGNVTPPKSYDQWSDFIEQLTRHLTERYGGEEVRNWYFEVWNEPNLEGFWAGSQEDYFRLYECTARAIKRVDKDYRVGGPSTAGGGWIKETLDFCEQHDVPLDFISTHTYGATEGFLDEKGNKHTTLDPNPKAITNWFPGVLGPIHKSKWPNLPLLVTEWGPSYSPRDTVHDSYFCAPYILEKLRRLPDGVTATSYWTFSDQFEESGPPPAPFHGGFGLLNVQGLLKPAYFAYRFLNELGDNELACDDSRVWACGNDTSAQILLWDFHQPHQDAPNAKYFARDLPAKPAAPVHLVVDHLHAGEHTVSITHVGYRHNDVYTAYLDLGAPSGSHEQPAILSDEDLAKLRAACDGKPERKTMMVGPGKPLSIDLPLNENDVYFVTIQ